MTIHATAIVHPSAQIGKNVDIGPYTVIGPDVLIGDDCQIMGQATIEYTELGKACRVFAQACLGLEPQHLKYAGEKTKLVVGDRCVFREGTTVHRGTVIDKGVTTIGQDCYFMALAHVAHDCRIGNKVIMANGAQLGGHVEVGDSVFISALVGVHQFVQIGKAAIISGGSMVSQNVPPFCIAQGDRAFLRGLNLVGMKRAGLNRKSIQAIKDAYKTVFLSGLSLKDALSTLNTQSDQEILIFLDFLLHSKRGFLRPAAGSRSVVEEEFVA